jgi:GntR family transcriptional repressor for pyruvate dehydrogenase complex
MASITPQSLPKVSKTSLVDEVIAVMSRMLTEEAWTVGAKLPSEQELGRQLGVGRSTIREALRVLGHLGIVESRSGLGTYVARREIPEGHLEEPQTPQSLQQLYEFRRAIEVPAARLAAERRTSAQLRAVQWSWEACGQAIENESPDEFARLDYLFHLSIMEASQNRFYIDAYRNLQNGFVSHVNLMLSLGPLRSMLNFHDGLILAIERSDPEAAAQAVEENFMETDVRLRLLSETA